MQSKTVTFTNKANHTLTGSLEYPSQGNPIAYVLMAHCFACTRKTKAGTYIARAMVNEGFAVLRFDFSGLGQSGGEFGDTNFSTNVHDLVAAADFLRETYEAPEILVGHSLGGTAVIEASKQIPECMAVSTIASPADPEHVTHLIEDQMQCIIETGQANVELAGRELVIKKQFIDNLKAQEVEKTLHNLNKAILIFHSPWDEIVSIEHAQLLYTKALHPKSFVSLDTADHLLTKDADAVFAASVIAGWANRYLPTDLPQATESIESVRVTETREGKFQQTVLAGKHRLFADEPESYGGMDSGPSPYDFLSIALGTCTGMTLRMYADRKGIELGRISVDVSHKKIHSQDCEECDHEQRASNSKIDRFVRSITIEGGAPEGLDAKFLEIADKCPVHKTLEASSVVATEISSV